MTSYNMLVERSDATQQAWLESCGSRHTALTSLVSDAARGQWIRTSSWLRRSLCRCRIKYSRLSPSGGGD